MLLQGEAPDRPRLPEGGQVPQGHIGGDDGSIHVLKGVLRFDIRTSPSTGQGDFLKARTAEKRPAADFPDILRNRDLQQAPTLQKGQHLDGAKALGEGDASQLDTVVEGALPNFLHALRDHDIGLQVPTAREGVVPDLPQAVWEHDGPTGTGIFLQYAVFYDKILWVKHFCILSFVLRRYSGGQCTGVVAPYRRSIGGSAGVDGAGG